MHGVIIMEMPLFAPMFRNHLKRRGDKQLIEILTGFGCRRSSWASVIESEKGPAVCYSTYNASELWKWYQQNKRPHDSVSYDEFGEYLAANYNPEWLLRSVLLNEAEYARLTQAIALNIPSINNTKFRGLDGVDRELIVYDNPARDYLWHETYPETWTPLVEMCAKIAKYLPQDMRETWECPY